MNFTKTIFQKIFRILFKINIHSEQNSEKSTSNYFFSRKLSKNVHIDIYLPTSYSEQKKRKYPVLFLNDAQDMKAVNLVSTLERLYAQKQLCEIIIFAFHPNDRMQEYGTQSTPDYAGRGNQSRAYQEFLTTEYLLEIKKKYRLSEAPNDWVIAGFSLGGLSAFDIAWNYGDIFGKVGVFSGALWWRSAAFKEDDPDADRIVHDYVVGAGNPPMLKFWFQTGTNDETDDRNNNGIIDSIDDTTDLIKLLKKGGFSDEDIVYREVENGEHNPETWGEVLPEFLKWAFPR
ncbi:MAG: enterochelin esterase-like enzyme [Saprospiraceae bacterium]|jgi:enterochelin esterase-like enzyme